MTPQEFAQKIKAKYPQYAGVDDAVLVDKIITKYPEYKTQVNFEQPAPVAAPVEQERSFGEKAGNVLDTVFGGGKIGEAIGTQIAKGTFGDTVQKLATGRDISPEEEALIGKGPTAGQIAGDVARVGATFVPVGKIAGAVGKGAQALGAGAGLAKLAGNVAGGATAGAIADVGTSMAEGEKPSLGLGTAVGAGLPVVGAVTRAATNLAGKVTGKLGSEVLGMTTGTSAETLEQAFNAARTGGKELDTLTNSLRGKTTPEQLVNNLRDSVAEVSAQRQQMFRQTLEELGDVRLDTSAARQEFIDNLAKAGIKVGKNGTLDFSANKLRLVPDAMNKVEKAFQEVLNLPQNSSLVDVDTSRQALKALSVAGNDPSANLANKLIDDAVRAVRGVGEQIPEYGTMLNKFAETSDYLDELQRGLSTGDNATIDQTYRRMTTAMKTNNEQRLQLVRELDDITGGSILSDVAGQQLSETLPRGITRQIAGSIMGGAAITGGISASWLPALALASPRVVGEFVRGLGLTAQKTDLVLKAIEGAKSTLLKMGAITGAVVDGSENK